MFRKDIFNKLGGYNDYFKTCQDFELWIRFAMSSDIMQYNKPLVKRYIEENSITRKKRFLQNLTAAKIRFMYPEKGYFNAFIYTTKNFIISYSPRNVKEFIKFILKSLFLLLKTYISFAVL